MSKKRPLPATFLRSRSDPAVPLHLFRHQLPMMRAWGGIAMTAWKPFPRKVPPNWKVPPVQMSEHPPPDDVIRWFVDWCHGDQAGYAGVVPPHLFPNWCLPICTRLLMQTGYPLPRIVNQGLSITINGDLPRGEPLFLRASLEDIQPLDGKVEFVQRVITSAAHSPRAIVTDIVSTLITKRRGPRRNRQGHGDEMREVRRFTMAEGDGLAFGLLSGDLNPMHWSARYARFMGQSGHIAHGFAQFARSYEALVETHGPIHQAKARFVAPLRLPVGVILYRSVQPDAEGWYRIELHSQPGDRLHMVGRVR